ncbi:hypothetical protein NW752_000157 [Fusarium irregulare]|nr:hypothetical protein NW752_000157 [Fusarium irregulare]
MSTDNGHEQRTARDLVKEIAKERGYLGEEQLAKIGDINPELRREVEEALLRKDEMIGSAVLTLARNLYTSNARFVFELLQNADDNNYSTAISQGQDPYVSFEVYPDKVTIECNENGFTPENLKAICAIGKSSKVGAAGYIGEKGIGFKSVFMAAWKVHIQSNDFSFSFTHRQGDSGLGMVTPVWEETEEPIAESLTRITLLLHTSEDPDEDERRRETIRLQFQDLQHTILLFLRKLRKVQVSFFDEDNLEPSTTTYSLHGSNPATIWRETPEGMEERQYHITKHIAENIPRSENRTYSEEGDRADSSAEVVLAFPLTDEETPIVENQDVFAFLPMRPMGFKFLIHTDFVTEASRQGIVVSSLRNRALLRGIADCFIKAIQEFCQHPTLQYQWMRWLPQRNTYPWDEFWLSLLERIETRMSGVKVLRTLVSGQLKHINNVCRLQSWLRDENGDPLFLDLDEEMYLAKEYTEDDLKLLEPYGLCDADALAVIKRIERDLAKNSKTSRMKSPDIDDQWHSLAARALLKLDGLFVFPSVSIRLNNLKLIPLGNGKWVSPSSGHLYYSHSEQLAIPKDLPLKLVDTDASSNPDRRALFDKLGVVEALVKDVRTLIMEKQAVPWADTDVLSASVAHLQFLYLSESLLEEGEVPTRLKGLHVYNQWQKPCQPLKSAVYMPTENEHEALKLLTKADGAPGLEMPFLHDNYLDEIPTTPQGFMWSWEEWLELRLHLWRHLRLIAKDSQKRLSISREFRYIERERPGYLLGGLQRSWKNEGGKAMPSAELLAQLRELEVPCRGRDEFSLAEPLSTTYLPLPELEGKLSRYIEDEGFIFLDLGEPITSSTYTTKWGFLVDHLGVGHTDDLRFYLSILKTIRYSNAAAGVRRNARVLDLYAVIHARCRDADSFLDAQAEAREVIEDGKLVYIPACKSRHATWASPDQCLWNAREDMQTAYPLAHLYRTTFNRSEEELEVLRQFFRKALDVRDCSWENYLDELRKLKALASDDFDWVNSIYESLDQERWDLMSDDAVKLRKAFLEEKLIYFNAGNVSRWYTVSECLWSSATQIRGRVALNDLYPSLDDFFVGFLGVQELTLDMAYDELKEMGARVPSPPIAAVKETIWALNSLLSSTEHRPDEEPVSRGAVFPVKHPNGSVKLQSGCTQFAIADRKTLGDIFGPQAKTLDFTLDEVRRLRPFLSWLNLESRYLSNSVREISTVSGGSMDKLQSPDREIDQRAECLYRIAVHFNSPRAQDDNPYLYWLLDGTKVYETDGISSELHLSQDGHGIVHVQDRSELHIREDGDSLKIYVPRDPKTQGFCYFSALPRRLLEWMMTDPVTLQVKRVGSKAVQIVTAILNAPLINVAQILEAEGIVDVAIPAESGKNLDPEYDISQTDDTEEIEESEVRNEEDQVFDELDSDDEADESASQLPTHPEIREDDISSPEGSIIQQFADIRSPPTLLDLPVRQRSPVTSNSSVAGQVFTPTSSTADHFDQGTGPSGHRTPRSNNFVRQSGGLFPEQTPSGTPSHPAFVFGSSPGVHSSSSFQFQGPGGATLPSTVEDEEYYVGLIDNVISHASRGTLPGMGAYDMSGLFSALPEIEDEGVKLSQRFSSQERDMRIGALGELYVFELLLGMTPSLPRFGRENWQSQMRRFVNGHPRYSDMQPWTSQETADICYHDRKCVLTKHLVEKGYLSQTWLSKKPLYLIEVKSTTGHSRTPFYVSKRQYKMMQDRSADNQTHTVYCVIYMIARVSNVDKSNIDLKLYIDPESMRKEGSLVFTPESWAVVPGTGTA